MGRRLGQKDACSSPSDALGSPGMALPTPLLQTSRHHHNPGPVKVDAEKQPFHGHSGAPRCLCTPSIAASLTSAGE